MCLSGFGAAEYPAIVMNLNKVFFWEKPEINRTSLNGNMTGTLICGADDMLIEELKKVNWLKIKQYLLVTLYPKHGCKNAG